MQCPSCGSEDCARLEIIYAEGTRDINMTTSTTSGGAVAGRVAFLHGGGHATGKMVSRLAQAAAPPERHAVIWPIVVWVIGLALLDWVLPDTEVIQTVAFVVWVAVCLLWEIRNIRHNFTGLPRERYDWTRRWMCRSCGNQWTP